MGNILVNRIGVIRVYNVGEIRIFLDCTSLPDDYMTVLGAVIEKIPIGGIFYDIGCHNGRYSLPVAKVVGEEGKVVGFEPNPARNRRTRRLIRMNQVGDIFELHEIALDMRLGYGTLYMPNEDYLASLSPEAALAKSRTSGNEEGRNERKNSITTTRVRTYRLDEYVMENNIRLSDVIKIDVQGAEYNVLVGAEAIIQQARPTIVIQVHVDLIREFGYSQEQLFALLHSWGYKVDTLGYRDRDLHIRALPVR